MAGASELARAIGSLIWKDPRRILENVAMLRGSGAVIECNLRGASMGTAIPAGSTVRVRLDAARPYGVGEVVAFVVHDGLCVHRIAYLGKGARARAYLVTQGDACFYPDAPIEPRHILGPVLEFQSGGGWLAVSGTLTQDRAASFWGRSLLQMMSRLLEIDVRLATYAARILRLRKERAVSVA